jgi:hypothetical protein
MTSTARNVIQVVKRLSKGEPKPDLSMFYPLMTHLHRQVVEEIGWRRIQYVWGILHSAHLAKMLGIKRISVIELGVAGGVGLMQMEKGSKVIERLLGTRIDVFGFDTGKGMPKPTDARDMPNLYGEGDYKMDVTALKARLGNARLTLGPVKETLPEFVSHGPAPIGFISFDVDYHSSMKDALVLLDAPNECLLPRVQCYMDDILGYSFGDCNGERLAIAEFNATHVERKLSPVYGLRFVAPPEQVNEQWTEKMYLAHILGHPRYGDNDGTMQRQLPLPGGSESLV